jgi:hypothetical protein
VVTAGVEPFRTVDDVGTVPRAIKTFPAALLVAGEAEAWITVLSPILIDGLPPVPATYVSCKVILPFVAKILLRSATASICSLVDIVIAPLPAVMLLIVRLLVLVLSVLVFVSNKLPTLIVPRTTPVPILVSELVTTTAPMPVLVSMLRVAPLVLNGVAVVPIVVPVVLRETVLPVARYVPLAASVITPFVPAAVSVTVPVVEAILAPCVIEPVTPPAVTVTSPFAEIPVLAVLKAPPLEIDTVCPDAAAVMAFRVTRVVCVSVIDIEPVLVAAVMAELRLVLSVISPLVAVRLRLPVDIVPEFDSALTVVICKRPPMAEPETSESAVAPVELI